ncbi:MAG: hypothetical protein ACFNWZ_01225 [Candidatus Absconditicoccaceae bacterium]
MTKKGPIIISIIYIFVIQAIIIGLLRNEPRRHILGGINFIATILLALLRKQSKQRSEQKGEAPLIREKHPTPKETTEKDFFTKEKKEESAPTLSESNIEYIKTRINRNRKNQTTNGGGLYRLLIFLLALIGFGGILYMFREIFDFIAIFIGAIGMMIAIMVIFRAAQLRERPIFSSLYFLTFFVLGCGGLAASLFGGKYEKIEDIKNGISTFIEGVKGKEITNTKTGSNEGEIDSDFLFERTGSVIEMNLSGDASSLSGEQSLSGDNINLIINETGTEANGLTSGESSSLPSGTGPSTGLSVDRIEEPTNTQTPASTQTKTSNQPSNKTSSPNQEVTMIDAIKHLIKTNNIPLSTKKNTKFTHIATSDSNYPYMKTALEKRMIGSNTNPNMTVSCDIYMVMKGLAEERITVKTADVKGDYRNMAESKNALNGCTKGAKLTVANL